jgi:hypothetical protein
VRGRRRLARHRTALIGRREPRAEALPNAEQNSQGILAVINSAGSDAIRLALGAVPMLILSLTIVGLLQGAGAIDLLQQLLKPLLSWLHIPRTLCCRRW